MRCSGGLIRTIILATALLSCISAVCASVISMSMQFREAQVNLNEFGNYIPPHFIVNESYDTIIRSHGSRHVSAVFSLVAYLEGLYHKFLVDAGEVYQNQTVILSEQAFMSFIQKLCDDKANEDVCYKLFGEDFSLEGISVQTLLEFMRLVPDMESSLFPYDVCEFKREIDDDPYVCNYSLDSKKNPLKLVVRNLKWASGVDSIKDLLYDTNKPVLFTMPELMADYYIRCSDPRVSNTTECKSGTIYCPYDMSAKCGIMSFPARTLSGEFFLPNEPVGVSSGSIINFEIVGYSDSFIPIRGRARINSMIMSKGGFIVKGATKEVGYPITYLTGDITQSRALFACPNNRASHHWAGPLLKCMLERNDTVNCSAKSIDDDDSDTKFESSDIVECINSEFCAHGEEYVVTHQPVRTFETVVYEEESGMTTTPLLKLGDPLSVIKIDQVPFHHLGSIFKKPNAHSLSTDIVCGYWFLPYDVVEKAMAISVNRASNVIAISLGAEFSESSLPSKMRNNQLSDMFKDFSRLPERLFTDYNLGSDEI